MKPLITNSIGKYMATGRSWYQRYEGGINVVTVHHTADTFVGTNEQILQREAGFHINGNGWPGLSYHYFITPDGTIFQINKHTDITWHDSRNTDTLGVALHGDFTNTNPSQKQLSSLKSLLDWLCTENPQLPASQQNVYGHREISPTACPGNLFFPLVVEYRTKLGNVSWGAPVANADEYVLRLSQALTSAENAITSGEQVGDKLWKQKNKANKSKLTSLAARL